MGEAWFMSTERFLYNELMGQDPGKLSTDYLKRVLWEIASGTKCFGHLEEWDDWFQFLLPSLIERSHEGWHFLENTMTAFFNVFDNGITEIYDGFRDDVIKSLSLCLMRSEQWLDWVDEVTRLKTRRPRFLVDGDKPHGWNCREASGEVSVSLFFCLKYLRPEEITAWVKSLVAINDPFWQAHFLVWMVGFDDFMKQPPAIKRRIERATPKIKWWDGFLNEPTSDKKGFLPEANVRAFLDNIHLEISAEVLFQWADSFSQRPSLQETLWDIPDIYFDKFISAE